MFFLKKTVEVAGAHFLELPYHSKCGKIHGHNWKIVIYARSETLTEWGMVVDFSDIKKVVMKLDHSYLNEIFEGKKNPTAENIAEFLLEELNREFYRQSNKLLFYRIDVVESDGNEVTYEVF
jgi:6-pyruvoyltetrahydropterin/6-carboxytetrahydropterin synthase